MQRGTSSLAPRHRRGTGRRSALVFVAAATFLTAGLAAGLVPGLAGAAARAARHAHKAATGNVASYALPTGSDFTWILPFEPGTNTESWNRYITNGMWMPLYYDGKGSKSGIDYTVSLAKPPVYSNGDTTVTITLNTDFTWSDGQKVTATDVKFFFQLDQAGKHTLGEYLPGQMPDNVTSVTYPSPSTVVLHLNHAYNPTWFTGNQLIQLYALPAQSWDKTCATCPVSNAATTPAGAKQVFKFLFSQSKDVRTYSTNPLWKTVDGPWVIGTYSEVTHAASFVANPHYTGPTKPKLAGYKIYSYTTGAAELDALRSGALTYGWLPLSDVKEASYFKSHGFAVEPRRFFYDMAFEFGYTSKTYGPLVKQLYLRQALQHLVTEQLYISKTYHGYGLVDYGPIANYPGSPYVSPTLRKDPYPYNLSAATHLLAEHGWKAGANGTDVCARPGTGPKDCGAGIKKGRALSLPFIYETGTTAFGAQVSAFATAAKKVGINIALDGKSQTTMFSIVGVCPSTPPCKYGIAGYSGYMWTYGPIDIVPSGNVQFGKGNYWAGGYTSPKAQQLINAASTKPGTSLQPLYAAEDYLSKNVASLWWPLADTLVVVKKSLKGWQQLNPYGDPNPMTWYFSG